MKKLLPFIFVFLACLYPVSDPDLGWHLKYGEYFFLNHEVLRSNILSSQMPGFLWTNISWGMDVITYFIFRLGGFWGLTLAGALVITLSFVFFSKAFKLDYWEMALIFPVILIFLQQINATSFRGQNVSLAFSGLLLYVLVANERKIKNLFIFVPLIFLFWANIHGLFFTGLIILILWQTLVLLKLLLRRNIKEFTPLSIKFVILTVLSFIATVIHPFGLSIYRELLTYYNNPLLKDIAEYLPAQELTVSWFNILFATILALAGFSTYVLGHKFSENIEKLGIFSVFYILSLIVKRFMWFSYFLLIPLLKPVAVFMRPDTKNGQYKGATALFLFYLLVVLYFKLPLGRLTDWSWDSYCKEFNKCSRSAAEALRNYYSQDKTMTLYNWGGWLIWNYPDLKPSTDGRMHLWRDKTGFSAFEYDFNLEQNLIDVNVSKYDVVFTMTTKPVYRRLKELESQNKWDKVYEDDTTGIFIRNRT